MHLEGWRITRLVCRNRCAETSARTKERKMVFGLLRTITNVSQEAAPVKEPLLWSFVNPLSQKLYSKCLGVNLNKFL